MNNSGKYLIWALLSIVGAFALGYIALNRGEQINALWIVVAAVCVYLIAYRFYGLYIAKNVLQVDPTRMTPAVRHNDGLDYVPTDKKVLFGHHFAAIAGAGPLVGPVLAAQMGYLPGMIWLLAGVVLAGAVQDFMVLFVSTRRDGRSLGELVKEEMGPTAGVIALIATFMIMVIILAVISVSVGVYIYSWRKSKKELMTLAYQDPVTLGDNFVAFKERAKSKKDGVGWLIAMDVTDFKLINSTCGVKKGDEVLRVIWEIFETETGENELAAHVNADRFILFWMDENQENIKQRLDHVIRKIEEIPERLEIPNLFPVFGIFHTIVLDEIDPLYGNAVQAKHQIKGRRDRHYIFYDELNHESIQENRELEEHFETALENEEFEIWYQPKYSAHSRKLVGAEALVRWRRADGALIPPLKFIPLFERNGNIIRLDEYVFRAVCRQQKEWQKQGQKMLPVSVNISRVSLYYSSVVEKYESIIRSFDLDSKYIQLEITESATIDNNEIFNLLEQFHTAGFKILLDDFGSGYSSLAALNRMHFDTIKLDKSLVDYIGDDNGEKLLNSITKLAQSFGMEITAEGVETVEQLMFLCNLDCDDIQGYYFSRPLPVKEYEECLKEACM